MLDIQVTIDGDKVVIQNLGHLMSQVPRAIDAGLIRVAKGVHCEAFAFLSGSRGPGGSYPVPVRTGWLRRSLDWLEPGQSKTGEMGTFTARKHEVVVYDSAVYANVVHEGTGTHQKFGKRPYLQDALKQFDEGGRIAQIISEEIAKVIRK